MSEQFNFNRLYIHRVKVSANAIGDARVTAGAGVQDLFFEAADEKEAEAVVRAFCERAGHSAIGTVRPAIAAGPEILTDPEVLAKRAHDAAEADRLREAVDPAHPFGRRRR